MSGATYLDDMFGEEVENVKDLPQISNSTYIEEIFRPVDEDSENTEVTDFYGGRNVLITGGTGFIGKLVIEKLLRECSKIGTVYLLMRARKGVSPQERLKAQFDDVIYTRLKRERPKFMKHIVIIEGDTATCDLGLSPENRKILIENTHIVLHIAATVRFDNHIRVAVDINVRGTKLMLLLAKEMKNLKAFVHVSTAFSQGPRKYVEEKFYDPPMELDNVFKMLKMFDDDTIAKITPHIINDFPNTYTFSKALGEEAVRLYGSDIPSCVVRPSIVISTYKEPVTGWTNNLYGPTGLVMAGYLCVLHSVFLEKKLNPDLIPADYVVNNIIVAAWDTHRRWTERTMKIGKELEPVKEVNNNMEPIVYNNVASCQSKMTWEFFFKQNYVHGSQVLCTKHVMYYFLLPTSNRLLYNIYITLFHILPAFILDNVAKMTGNKPMLADVYKKIHKLGDSYNFFKLNEWKFNNDNVMGLWQRTTMADRLKFDFNLESINWDEYAYYHIRGIRSYFIKEPLNTHSKAEARYKIIVTINIVVVALFLFLCYMITSWIFKGFYKVLFCLSC